jgi:protein TonB
LLVGAPLITGCPEDEPPIVNTPPLPPNPFGTEEPPPQTPTMEGVGVPLPTPDDDAPPTLNTVPMPTPNTVAQPEAIPEPPPPPTPEPERIRTNVAPGSQERSAD